MPLGLNLTQPRGVTKVNMCLNRAYILVFAHAENICFSLFSAVERYRAIMALLLLFSMVVLIVKQTTRSACVSSSPVIYNSFKYIILVYTGTGTCV